MQTKGNFVPAWTEDRVKTCSELGKRPIKGEYLVELLRSERAPPTMYNENVIKKAFTHPQRGPPPRIRPLPRHYKPISVR